MQIPLLARDGTLRGYATISPEDYEALSGYTWRLAHAGYAKRGSGRRGVAVYMHRQVLELDRDDERFVDHINGDRLDNRRENLRAIDPAVSAQNRAVTPNKTSRFRGVCRTGNRWRAGYQINGRWRWVGYFSDELAAAEAARQARTQHMPFAVERETL